MSVASKMQWSCLFVSVCVFIALNAAGSRVFADDVARRVAPTAEELMRRAHQARAVWKDFPGFAADITVAANNTLVKGRVTVSADGDVQLVLPEIAQVDWVAPQLQSLVMHRQADGTEHYDVSFADNVTAHPLGRLIRFNNDRLHSMYRIDGDVITEVHRTMGETRFTITILDVTRNAEGKYLPHIYTVSWWDADTGDLKKSSMALDEWVRVGRFDLPSKVLRIRTSGDGKRDVQQIEFANHRLLQPAEAP